MDMDRIKSVIDLMREHELSEFSIEDQDFKLSLKRGSPGMAAPLMGAGLPPPPAEEELTPIASPLVGTFYRASSPDADPFVSVGARVNKDTVVCIIEAMKVMNEIKAETSGVIKKILVENATAVQFGQPMFLVEKG
jgi:acetyl-CoA carboxylase biotin carboxyl carrier protein